MLAKALAGESKAKELFKLARKSAPCVLFIDEVDGIGKRTRSGEGGGAESELNRIINRVLVEMDGFEPLDNVVVVAATNHEDNIDEAMRRPGRFDMLVRLGLPTLPERQRLFELYLGKVTHDGRADTAALARMTGGMSPAEIANTVNKAASSAAEAHADHVSAEHLLRAIGTHQLGGEVSSVSGDELKALFGVAAPLELAAAWYTATGQASATSALRSNTSLDRDCSDRHAEGTWPRGQADDAIQRPAGHPSAPRKSASRCGSAAPTRTATAS